MLCTSARQPLLHEYIGNTQHLSYVRLPGGDMDYAQWEGKQMGSYGEGAGAAYLFSRSGAVEGYVWEQDQVGR